MITREQLLAAPRKKIIVRVPELSGGAVTLQSPTAGEWLDYQRWLATLPGDSLDHLIRIVAITAIDAQGKPLLTDEDCREIPHHILAALARAAFDLTRTDEQVESAKGES